MRRLLPPLAALIFLDASVTFTNWWPTPAVTWFGEPSVELAIVLLVLVVAAARGAVAMPPRANGQERSPASNARQWTLVGWLSAGWLLLVIGRYVDVTAPALWGRELNFYWDLRFLPDVAAMLLGASSRAVLLGTIGAGAVLLLLAALFIAIRWSFRQVLIAISGRSGRFAVGVVASLGVGLFALQAAGLFGLDLLGEEWRLFPRPVTQVYARQVRLMVQAVSKSAQLPPSPDLDVNLSRLGGADVFLFFIESYGAVAFEKPAFNDRLREPRALLDHAIHATGREVVSAFVESPTFGGSSWFAHITFLSGIKVGDPDANALLMTEQRPTVVTNFARRGYRTIAMMPGLWYPWPEGAFYGFQDIYNGPKLDYQGPPFGWWDMPDQFTLARLDEQEVSKVSRPPLFVFYPTVSTHTPFSPLAPYQPDWAKMLTPAPFTQDELHRAWTGEPDYLNLGPGYGDAVAYAYQTFAGYLEQRQGRDYVMILIGDHQPPALVSGEGAPWDVPMHVITNRPAILEGLVAQGFVRGLTPARPRLGEMHQVVPIVLSAFSDSER
ncbi:MAG TPA: sulfatase-like hydrolase/transferase [Vicinamibacterales bacterium]|nr:sulfatase-like hydrolase/transferase [Vicinamibacterales bacterium]